MEVEHSEEQSDEPNARNEHEVDNSSIFGENVSRSEQSDEDSYEERTSEEESEVEMERDEELCDESDVDRTSDEENTVQYHVMHDTSQRNKSKLFDSRGFQYTLSRQVKEVKYWRCAEINKKLSCTARIIEKEGVFQASYEKHVHKPSVGVDKVASITKNKGARCG